MSESLGESPIRTADAIWVATALLHMNNKEREYFTIPEIFNEVEKIDLGSSLSPSTIRQYISSHCVANTNRSPDTFRYLFRVYQGNYRIYKPDEGHDDSRKNGQIIPVREMLPQKYRHLLDWYENDYCKRKVNFEEHYPWLENPQYMRVENYNRIEIPGDVMSKLGIINGDYVGFIEMPNGRIQLQKMKIKVQAQ